MNRKLVVRGPLAVVAVILTLAAWVLLYAVAIVALVWAVVTGLRLVGVL